MVVETCCCENSDYMSGCMICGKPLFCTPDKPLKAKCYFCGEEHSTHYFCLDGHYVCDLCHSKGILHIVEMECNKSLLRDPVELLLKIFSLPNLHMHGPEYHSIVPAVLVAAYGNTINNKNSSDIAEAIKRGKRIFGGICGTHGTCGACIGVGIAYSVIHKVTPYSKEDRGDANKMTALALTAISQYGGPRCCKRDSMIAVETAKKHFSCFEDDGKSKYICSQYPNNDMCIRANCPYFPTNVDYRRLTDEKDFKKNI